MLVASWVGGQNKNVVSVARVSGGRLSGVSERMDTMYVPRILNNVVTHYFQEKIQ